MTHLGATTVLALASRWSACAAALVALVGAATAAEGATLTGTVSWSSPEPPRAVSIARDRHVCGAEAPILDRSVTADARGRARGVWVFLEGVVPPEERPRAAPPAATIDQRNCTFVPAVQVVRPGQVVRVTSSDPVLHNVHVREPGGRTVANFAMPAMGQVATFRAPKTGPLELRCEAGHDWMSAALLVLDHPHWSETDGQGRYRLEGVPPGRYVLVAWHPELGRREVTVQVPVAAPADEGQKIDFVF